MKYLVECFLSVKAWVKPLFVVGCLLSFPVESAVDVIEFDIESQRARYQLLSAELRCPKCQNQNLLDSNSQISIDLRQEVARLIKEGKTDREVKTFLVDRYGDFVLYSPPVQANTLVLWWAPVLLLGSGVLVFVLIVYRRQRQPINDESTLNESEREKLESWLDSDEENKDEGVA